MLLQVAYVPGGSDHHLAFEPARPDLVLPGAKAGVLVGFEAVRCRLRRSSLAISKPSPRRAGVVYRFVVAFFVFDNQSGDSEVGVAEDLNRESRRGCCPVAGCEGCAEDLVLLRSSRCVFFMASPFITLVAARQAKSTRFCVANNGEKPTLAGGQSHGPHLGGLVGAGTRLAAYGGFDLRALLAEDRDEAANRVLLPAGRRHDLVEGGPVLAADQGEHLVFLRGARGLRPPSRPWPSLGALVAFAFAGLTTLAAFAGVALVAFAAFTEALRFWSPAFSFAWSAFICSCRVASASQSVQPRIRNRVLAATRAVGGGLRGLGGLLRA